MPAAVPTRALPVAEVIPEAMPAVDAVVNAELMPEPVLEQSSDPE